MKVGSDTVNRITYSLGGKIVKNILVVDDAVFMRKYIAGCLENSGLRVVGEAGDGYEAIEKYKKLNPDIVIMDITMPKMSGIDAIKEIYKIDPKCRIVVCSALTAKQTVNEAIKAGAKDYIAKPFDESSIVSVIQRTADLYKYR